MHRVLRSLLLVSLLHGTTWASGADPAAAAPKVLTPADNLVLEHIPPIPQSLADDTARYGEARPAALLDWHPRTRAALISTRFGETNQIHAVAMPGGARRQLTFFPDRVRSARYLPDGKALLIQKDVGGGEWYQLYRFDLSTGTPVLLTDGQSRNDAWLLAHHSTRMVFTSTRRNNKDSDLWITDAAGVAADARLLLQVEGGGWQPLAWSPDNRRLLVLEELSINESRLWLVDVEHGEKTAIKPGIADTSGTPVHYAAGTFSHDGRSLYVLTDADNEFQRLARIDLASARIEYLSTSIPWDIEQMTQSEDGRLLAFVSNERGFSHLHVLDTRSGQIRHETALPDGILAGLAFQPDNHTLGFDLNSARSPSDIYTLDLRSHRLSRWTEGETGGLDAAHFAEPRLVTWKGFDGLELSGFLYAPDPARFPGPRPVMIAIHGGPESQFRPVFIGRNNYLIDHLGVALLFPNVRGSAGYGKTFLKLDNGFHRDESYRDIATLLDWIDTQSQLAADRVMVYGGSYGGHMTWAVSAFYSERIRCGLPIVGMSNLVTFLEHTEAYRRDLRRVEYGDERDPAMREYLERIAPMNHIDSIRKPIFAVAGKNDPRVPWTESRQILDKLNAQGTPTWFLMANDEGHGFAKKKNNDFLFNAEVMFVDRCLLSDTPFAARTDPAAPAAAGADPVLSAGNFR